MVGRIGRRAAVFEQHAFVAAVVAVTHRGVHADVGGDAGEHDIADATGAQHQIEIGGAEGTLAGFVDDDLTWQRLQFIDDFPARLTSYEDLAAGTVVADAYAVGGYEPNMSKLAPEAEPIILKELNQLADLVNGDVFESFSKHPKDVAKREELEKKRLLELKNKP